MTRLIKVIVLTIPAEVRKSYLTSLEHREAVLLTLVDRQVEVKQEMLEEMRLEVAAARARVLAAKEEGMEVVGGGWRWDRNLISETQLMH